MKFASHVIATAMTPKANVEAKTSNVSKHQFDQSTVAGFQNTQHICFTTVN